MYTRIAALFAAAALSTAGVFPANADDAAAPRDAAPRELARQDAATGALAALPAGVKPKPAASDNKAIRETFEDLTEAALMDNDFDDLVERLVDQDRNRIGKFAEQSFEDLNVVGQRIRDTWKAKYGGVFEFDSDVDFKDIPVVRGEIEDPRQVATTWPVAAVTAGPGEAVQAASSHSKTSNDNPDLNSNIEKGREVAIATIPASHGLPALNISLVKELNGYRVDAPNTLSGQQLHDDLLKHLRMVAESSDRWPADKRQAATMIAHHVMMSIYGVDAPLGGAAAGGDRAGDARDAATPPRR